ncbi:MAG: hypothetical protein H6745_08245 [Deltaproteobacteria bacterium]|nr:hypothetical protein [Deltaproteobacteria bacterium]
MSPAKDPHHRAPADDPRLAPRRTTAADHATSEAALRPGKDGQSPALAPPNAAALAKVAATRASLAKDIADLRFIAETNVGTSRHPLQRGPLGKLTEPIVHAVDGVDTPAIERDAILAERNYMRALGLLGAAEALLAADEPRSLGRAVDFAAAAGDLLLATFSAELDAGPERQRFYAAESQAAADVGKVSRTVAKIAMYSAFLAGGGAAITVESALVQGIGKGVLTSMAKGTVSAVVDGDDALMGGIEAAPGGAIGGALGAMASPITGPLVEAVAPSGTGARFLAEIGLDAAEGAGADAVLDALGRSVPTAR